MQDAETRINVVEAKTWLLVKAVALLITQVTRLEKLLEPSQQADRQTA